MSRFALLILIALAAGCAQRVAQPPLSTDHPAHPDAPQSAVTLAPDPFDGVDAPEAAPGPATPDHEHHHHGDGEAAAKQTSMTPAGYPVDFCVVSDQKLGSMGEPVSVTHEGRTVWLCCSQCVDDFRQTPAQYIRKLDAAAARHQPKGGDHEGH